MTESLQDGGGHVLPKEQQDWVARKWVRILLYSMGDVMKDCNMAVGMGQKRFESYRGSRTYRTWSRARYLYLSTVGTIDILKTPLASLPPVVTTENVSAHCQISPGSKITPG